MITEERAELATPPDGFIRRFMEYGKYVCDAPLAYHLGTALAVYSTIVDEDLGLFYGGGPLHSHFWTLLVGDSSVSRKTVSLNLGVRILREVDPYRIGGSPESEAGLIEALAIQPQQLIPYGEFGAFLAGTQARSYKEALRTRLMSIYDADTQSRVRVSQTTIAEDPRLSLIAGVAPSLLEKHTDENDWMGGFMARWACFAAKRERTYDPPPDDGWSEMYSWLVEYLSFKASVLTGPCLGWSREGLVMWKDWTSDMRKRFQNDVDTRAAGGLERSQAVGIKTALNYAHDFGPAGTGTGAGWHLGPDVLGPALQVADMHVDSVLWVIDSLASTPFARDRRTVLRAVHGKPRTLKSLIQRCRGELSKGSIIKVLETLTEEEAVFAYAVSGATVIYSTQSPADNPFAEPGENNVISFPHEDLPSPPESHVGARPGSPEDVQTAPRHQWFDE